ncbi:DUF475 domain-containing protein [Patescibacteria group bacterium]|nr:DUF475 domain-containing protein [Patescibacteria group bacterium]
MDYGSIILTVLGLCLFEIVSSIDNAVVNADVLATMKPKWRNWFLGWGIFIGVFMVRGLLPWLIVWLSNASLSPWEALTITFSSDPLALESFHLTAPYLLLGGGIFLVFLFFYWLFLEKKHCTLFFESFCVQQGIWFFSIVSILLTILIWLALKKEPSLALAAAIGSSAFFIVYGFREQAEKAEKYIASRKGMSDISKLLYLEVLDATFSIDGVVGAFAFTLSIPLIIIGNGVGAIIVREFTIKGVDTIKKYLYLKNGAMYSIFCLGTLMILEGFGYDIPAYISPVITFVIVGYFWWKSRHAIRMGGG